MISLSTDNSEGNLDFLENCLQAIIFLIIDHIWVEILELDFIKFSL